MDKFYPEKQAAATLEELTALSKHSVKARAQESLKHLGDLTLDDVCVVSTGKQNKQWRLCTPADSEGVSDEVIFRTQGVVSRIELVPKNVQTCGSKNAIYLKQHVEVIGLKLDSFSQAAANVALVYDKFSQHLAGVPMADFAVRTTGDVTVLSASNRFFTLRTEVPTEQDNDFHDGVDPLGRLARLKGNELIHSPDNIVNYYRVANTDADGHTQYVSCVPGLFKVGDIVEMQLSFVAMLAKKVVKVGSRLQALTLLSDKFTKEAAAARALAAKVSVAHSPSLRRKVGYFYEDDEELKARKRVNQGEKGDGGSEKE